MKTIKFLLIVIITLLFVSCNNNRARRKSGTNISESGMMTNNTNTSSSVSGKDADFAKDASKGSMMEVELGKIAEQNALNPRVKNFGAMMVRDHSKANEALDSIAKAKNITLPDAMQENRDVSDLQKKTGNDFDKDYMKDMVNDHTKDIEEFKNQANNGNDADLKDFASKSLPLLQMHLDSAKAILQALK